MEYWSDGGIGVTEWWSVGLGVIWVVAGVNAIGFVDDQCFRPRTGIPLTFKSFD
jgi:hypothetical protein